MPALIRDLVIECGAVWDDLLALKTNGQPLDLTGATARMQIRDLEGNLIIELSTGNGRLLIDGPAGTIQRRLGATVTAAITAEKGKYDMEIIPGGNPDFAWKLYRGKVKFEPEQTHD